MISLNTADLAVERCVITQKEPEATIIPRNKVRFSSIWFLAVHHTKREGLRMSYTG
jgi:hypothetical protein